jgi:hypothetical protein
MDAESFVCPYCGGTKNRSEQSVEHPLPRAIGGAGFSSPDYCDPCNKRAGREVDQPFVSHVTILAMRHVHGVPDSGGEIPPAPRVFGDIDTGGRGYVELGSGLPARRVPEKTHEDETHITYTVEEGDGEELARKVAARVRKQLGDGVEIETHVEHIERDETVRIEIRMPETLWPRFAAKLGLAFGREALGDDWVLTDDAAVLRHILWDDEGAPKLSPTWEQAAEDDEFSAMIQPPTHFLAVVPRIEGGCSLIIQLFGALRYAVPLSDRRPDGEWPVWTFDPIEGTARSTTLMQLVVDNAPETDLD